MAFINKKTTFLILALLFALLSIPIIGKNYEGFTNLTPGSFPTSVDVPLLHEYPLKQQLVYLKMVMKIIILIIPFLDLLMDNLPIMLDIGQHLIMVNVLPQNFVEDSITIKK